jgi:predicted Zn-dependent protease
MRVHRFLRPAWLVLVLLAPVALPGCATNPSTGRSQLILLSPEEVSAMGAEATPEMIREFGGEVPEAALRAYVDRVGRALAAHVEPEFGAIKWEFHVLDSDVVNAFALPGGHVFITRGLLAKFDSEAEVAGVLGHEIGHVTGRHVDERLSQALVAEFGLAVLGQYTETELIRIGAEQVTSIALLKFSRDQEAESDDQGLKYMTAAGYDPRGLADVMRVLIEASGGASPPEFLATHPHPQRRLAAIEEAIAGPYAHTQGSRDYGRYRGRFRRDARPFLDR